MVLLPWLSVFPTFLRLTFMIVLFPIDCLIMVLGKQRKRVTHKVFSHISRCAVRWNVYCVMYNSGLPLMFVGFPLLQNTLKISCLQNTHGRMLQSTWRTSSRYIAFWWLLEYLKCVTVKNGHAVLARYWFISEITWTLSSHIQSCGCCHVPRVITLCTSSPRAMLTLCCPVGR
jgi:hypothetical protein